MPRYITEKAAQNKLRKWVYKNFDSQKAAAKKLKTSECYLGHVLNYRKGLTKSMQKALNLEYEKVVRYRRKDP